MHIIIWWCNKGILVRVKYNLEIDVTKYVKILYHMTANRLRCAQADWSVMHVVTCLAIPGNK